MPDRQLPLTAHLPIIRQFGKFDRLPGVVRTLDTAITPPDTTTLVVSFANTRAYLEAMGFDKVYDEAAFPISATRGGRLR